MRVTAKTQAATRERILSAARRLFAANGFEAATTRDIAEGAEIGVGTLFNYFPTKEAIVACLAAEAASEACREFTRRSAAGESFEEDLFAFVAAGLRKLKPLRKNLPTALETGFKPLAAAGDAGQSWRVAQLEAVNALAQKHGFKELAPLVLQIYWSLYSGLLLSWAIDKSPRQEDTLALLDHSLEMFAGWLNGRTDDSPTQNQKTAGEHHANNH
jgi:AcrR family transcriptional regulator